MKRLVALVAMVSGVLGGASSCNDDPKPLAGEAGTSETRRLGEVAVPGAFVDVVGLNLRFHREDFSIDTRIGRHQFGAVYNSVDGAWRWTHDMTLEGGVFTDYTGARYEVGSLPPGQSIPGTWWVLLGGQQVRTKGGLVHEFVDGRISDMYWASDPYPRVRVLRIGEIATKVVQCVAPGDCADVYSFEYDPAGRLAAVDDRSGRRTEYQWDSEGRLVVARDPMDVARAWSGRLYEYDGDQITSVTSSEGERVEYLREGHTLRVRAEGEGSPTWEFHREPKQGARFRTRVVDPLSRETIYAYDGSRRVREVIDPLGDTVAWAWSGRRPSGLTLPDGVVWSWILDGDEVAREIQPGGNIVEFEYVPTAVNRGAPLQMPVARVADSMALVLQRTHDSFGRQTEVMNGAGEVLRFTYGDSGELTSTTAPDGRIVGFDRYGEHGHPVRLLSDGRHYDRRFDRVGNLLQRASIETDTPGVHSREYDEDRNVALILTAEQQGVFSGSLLPMTIDHRSDHRVSAIVRFGPSTSFVYDEFGRPIERWQSSVSGWDVTHFEWTPDNRLAAAESPDGTRREFVFDPVGRLVWQAAGRRVDGGPMIPESVAGVSWKDGRVASVFDGVHLEAESYVYDGAGRLASVSYPGGETLAMAWDLRSRISSMHFEDAVSGLDLTLELGYGPDGRQNYLGVGGNLLVQQTRVGGRLAETAYGNGLTRRFTPASGLEQTSETMDALGNIVAQTSITRYDGESGGYCLRQSASTYGVSVHSVQESWCLGLTASPRMAGAPGEDMHSWSWSGNPTQIGEGSFSYEYLSDRLTEIRKVSNGAVLHDYAYDAAGRVSERDGEAVSWDAAGRATEAGDWALEWDGLGRPLAEHGPVEHTTRRFGGIVEADADGAPVALDLGEVRIDLASGERVYRHLDPRGNVTFTTDRDGRPRTLYRYHPFGVAETQGETGDRIRFALGRQIGDLVLLGHRLLDPASARFLAPDPIYQTLNQYTYANGNSLLWWDPNGLEGTFHGATAGQWASAVGFAAVTGMAVGLAGSPVLGVVAAGLQVISEGGGFPWEGDRTVGDLVEHFVETAGGIQRGLVEPLGDASPLGFNGLNLEALPVGSVAHVIGVGGEGSRGPGPGPGPNPGSIPICTPLAGPGRVPVWLMGVLLCANVTLCAMVLRRGSFRDRP